MSRIKKLNILILIVLLFSIMQGYANGSPVVTQPKTKKILLHQQKKSRKRQQHRKTTDIKMAPFNSIVTNGYFDLRIMQGPQRVVIERSAAADQINIRVERGTLYLTRCCVEPTDKDLKETDIVCINEPIVVKIWLPDVEKLDLSGVNSVVASNFNSYGITINANDDSHITLRGVVSVHKIVTTGNSDVNIRWVNSDGLTIIARDASHIYLAGVTRSLRARAFGSAEIDARYLRAKEILVQAEDQAAAYVTPIDSLSAFATDTGNIYYYKIPNHHLEYTQLCGNVLQMGNWR